MNAGGAPLQNRGHGFSLDATHPNVVAGGKRPFHTIIPGMVRRDGRVHLVYGLVGGPMQPQGHVQVLRHLLDHGLDAQAALDRPRTFWPLTRIGGASPPVVSMSCVDRGAPSGPRNTHGPVPGTRSSTSPLRARIVGLTTRVAPRGAATSAASWCIASRASPSPIWRASA